MPVRSSGSSRSRSMSPRSSPASRRHQLAGGDDRLLRLPLQRRGRRSSGRCVHVRRYAGRCPQEGREDEGLIRPKANSETHEPPTPVGGFSWLARESGQMAETNMRWYSDRGVVCHFVPSSGPFTILEAARDQPGCDLHAVIPSFIRSRHDSRSPRLVARPDKPGVSSSARRTTSSPAL